MTHTDFAAMQQDEAELRLYGWPLSLTGGDGRA
jgi:hypothetical protein